ncbi:hypothetical protein V6N13_029147 [Hibiscus sabdariffa]
MVGSSRRESESSEEKSLKRILGHNEEEALWRLHKCALGNIATVCSSNSVEERLHERITWIQAEGIPLHCWNHTTFKRLAKSWGSLIALGENASHLLDGDKRTLLVSTSQRSSIDEEIELEVGRDCFLIQIKESGFNIHSAFKLKDENRNPCNQNSDLKNRESSSESSSENVRVPSPAVNLIRNEHLTDAVVDAAANWTEVELPPHFRVMVDSFDVRLATMQSHFDGRLNEISNQQSVIQTEVSEIRRHLNDKFDILFVAVGNRSEDLSTSKAPTAQ